MKYLLCIFFTYLYVQAVTQQTNQELMKSTSVTKVPTMKHTNGAVPPVKGAAPIIYCLKSEVSIMLLCQLFLTCY